MDTSRCAWAYCAWSTSGCHLGSRAEAKPVPDQPSARLGSQLDIGHELRPASPALQNDLAAVECFKLRPVPDADNGQRGQLLREQFHQLVLAVRIERRRRLIKHHDVRLVQE